MAPLAVLVLSLSAAPATQTIAMPVWSTVDVKPELAIFFAEQVAESLRHEGLQVITSNEIATLLGSQRQAQLSGCDEQSKECLAEISNALGAQLTLTGTVAKLDESFEVRLKLIRSTSGQVVTETRVSAKGQTALMDELSTAGKRIAEVLKPAPAGGSGSKTFAWSLLAAGAVVAAAGGGCLIAASSQYSSLETYLHNHPVDSKATGMQGAGNGLQYGGWAAIGVGAAGLIAGLVMVLWPAPVTPAVSVTPNGASFGLAGAF